MKSILSLLFMLLLANCLYAQRKVIRLYNYCFEPVTYIDLSTEEPYTLPPGHSTTIKYRNEIGTKTIKILKTGKVYTIKPGAHAFKPQLEGLPVVLEMYSEDYLGYEQHFIFKLRNFSGRTVQYRINGIKEPQLLKRYNTTHNIKSHWALYIYNTHTQKFKLAGNYDFRWSNEKKAIIMKKTHGD